MLVIGRKNGHGGLHMLGYYLEESLEYDPIRGPWWVLFHTSVLFNDSSRFPNFKKSYFPCISGGVTHLLQNSAVCVAAEHVLQ